jgi:NTE family protein
VECIHFDHPVSCEYVARKEARCRKRLRRSDPPSWEGSMDADLVLEGGGVKGIGLVGAYSVLEEAGYEVHRIAGSSAGAIVGALIASGMHADDMQNLMREVDYGRFEDAGFLDHLGLVGRGLSLLFEKGIYEGKYFRQWIEGTLADLGVRTFGDLRIEDPGSSLTPDRQYKLVVMSSDVTRGRLARLPWDYDEYGLDPDEQVVADAIRASMSIPFFYEPVPMKTTDERGSEIKTWMVDGGMLSNFPVDVFDRTDGSPPRWPTFGMKLSARPESAMRLRFEIHGTFDFAKALVGTMTNFHDQIHIEEESVVARTMFVDTTGVKATDFHLDEPTQNFLYTNGRKAATGFLATWDFEGYKQTYRTAEGQG